MACCHQVGLIHKSRYLVVEVGIVSFTFIPDASLGCSVLSEPTMCALKGKKSCSTNRVYFHQQTQLESALNYKLWLLWFCQCVCFRSNLKRSTPFECFVSFHGPPFSKVLRKRMSQKSWRSCSWDVYGEVELSRTSEDHGRQRWTTQNDFQGRTCWASVGDEVSRQSPAFISFKVLLSYWEPLRSYHFSEQLSGNRARWT